MAGALTAGGYGELAGYGYSAGRYVGDVIKTFTGFGEYKVNSNTLYEGSQAPYVRNFSSNAVVISHREYIMDVITGPAQTFNLQNFFLNPGLSNVFEFLAQVAPNFEQYVPLGIIFAYRPMSSDATNSVSGNVTLGTVIMCTNYNVYEPNYSSKAEMEAAQYCMSCKPSAEMLHPIECDMSLSPNHILFVRSGTIPTGQDQRLYDFCNFQIATSGFQSATQNIGELWVSYEFAFLKPRLYGSLGKQVDYFVCESTNPATANILGTAATWVFPTSNNITVGITYPANNQVLITFPSYPMPCRYYMSLEWNSGGGNVNIPTPTISTSTNVQCSFATIGNIIPSAGSNANSCVTDFLVICSGGLVTVSQLITLSAFPAFVGSLFRVTQVPVL